MKKMLMLLLLLGIAAIAFGEDVADLQDGIISAEGLISTSVGGDLSLKVQFTDVQYLDGDCSWDVSEGRAATGARLILSFTVTNYDMETRDLRDDISATLTAAGQCFGADVDFEDERLEMLTETSGHFVFHIPGVFAADADQPMTLNVTVGETHSQSFMDISADVQAMGYTAEKPETGVFVRKMGDRIFKSRNGGSEDAFRFIVADFEIMNLREENLTIKDAISGELTYRERFRYEASVESLMPILEPMACGRITLVFRVPYMVATDTDVMPDMSLTVDGVPQRVELDLKASRAMTHAYALFEGRFSWDQAKTACEAMGGHLATITSEDENDLVKTLFNEGTVPMLGGYADSSRVWHWVTGEDFVFTSWLRGQPDNMGKNENKLNMYTNKDWNDTKGIDQSYICEWEDESLCTVQVYRTFSVDPEEIGKAPAFRYDELVSAEGLQVQFGRLIVYSDFSAGADDHYRYVRVALDAVNRGSTPLSIGNAFEAKMQYMDRYSFDAQVVCGADMLEPLEIRTVQLVFRVPSVAMRDHPEGLSLDLWVQGERTDIRFNMNSESKKTHVYAIISGNLNWDEARIACEKLGGYLAVITDAAENTFILGMFGSGVNPWIGAYADDSRQWHWITSEPFEFSSWNYGEPNNEKGQETYLGFYNGGWNDYPIMDANINAYVCEWEDVLLVPEGFTVRIIPQ